MVKHISLGRYAIINRKRLPDNVDPEVAPLRGTIGVYTTFRRDNMKPHGVTVDGKESFYYDHEVELALNVLSAFNANERQIAVLAEVQAQQRKDERTAARLARINVVEGLLMNEGWYSDIAERIVDALERHDNGENSAEGDTETKEAGQ